MKFIHGTSEQETLTPDGYQQNKDNTLGIGYIILAVSVGFFVAAEQWGFGRVSHQFGDQFMLFIAHYIMAIAYVIILAFNQSFGIRKSWHRDHIHKTVVLVNLFLLSSFALNRELNVIRVIPYWLATIVVATSAAALGYQYYPKLPLWLRRTIQTLTGAAIVFYLCITICTIPYYFLGGTTIIFFGIGAHIFVPLFICAIYTTLIAHTYKQYDRSFEWILAGVAIALSLAISFFYNGQFEGIINNYGSRFMIGL